MKQTKICLPIQSNQTTIVLEVIPRFRRELLLTIVAPKIIPSNSICNSSAIRATQIPETLFEIDHGAAYVESVDLHLAKIGSKLLSAMKMFMI